MNDMHWRLLTAAGLQALTRVPCRPAGPAFQPRVQAVEPVQLIPSLNFDGAIDPYNINWLPHLTL